MSTRGKEMFAITAAEFSHLEGHARNVRRHVLDMMAKAKSSHIGTAYSMVDLLVALYWRIMRVDPSQPEWPARDRLLLSKGHGAAGLYAALADRGYFDTTVLDEYYVDGGRLGGHPTWNCVPGVEFSSGSLGHGLPFGLGLAMGLRTQQPQPRAFVLMGDGECNEGSVWEAAMFAAREGVDNLVAIIDHNKLQGLGRVDEICALSPLAEKWQAFGWSTVEIDGHDFRAILEACEQIGRKPGVPTAIVAHTVKGKGVSFMEDQLAWHYKSPNAEEVSLAHKELSEQ